MIIENKNNGTRSKKRLTDALLRLMTNYIYSEITITQICQEAQLSRKTFYRLFRTKDDIINELIVDMHAQLISKIEARHSCVYQEIAFTYFEFWHAHKALLLLIKKQDVPFDFDDISRINAMEIYHLVKSDKSSHVSEHNMQYVLAYCIGGLNSMLLQWVDQGALLTPKELTQLLKYTLETPLF
ncbi:TetR/AcrR family transcriptional regulator [Fusibacter paucivorans]|uniref:TetR/AcrR family transcriptional regulator n=1 Tax=Fusibacter paucivorans TaxID=76009 RepID=A0ABS5PPP0_9FIRM|nr:TetR/AcrR family transcriptional regulator [Fusibacter paucivorans]MBS7526887.1 TetR/AcrR family transcriptional regulator [Fusibacter paucivorans]